MLVYEEKSTIEKLLRHMLDNPSASAKCAFLDEMLNKEDFIIFFYIREFSKNSLILSEDFLRKALHINGLSWLDKRSVLNKKFGQKVDKDYLQTKVENKLVKDIEYVEALKALVVKRYRELKSIELEDAFLLDAVLLQMKGFIEAELGKKLLEDQIKVMQVGVYENNKHYTKENFLEYTRDRVNEMINLVNTDLSSSNYSDYTSDTMIEGIKTFIKLFDWNLGAHTHLPKAHLGEVLSLIGSPGVGKTRFCVGEIAYPVILAGKNIAYYSCEMTAQQLLAMLVVKHIYVLFGYTIDLSIITKVLAVHLDLIKKEVDIEEYTRTHGDLNGVKEAIAIYTKATDEIKEVVSIAYNDLIISGKYGKFFSFRQSDGVFIVEDLIPLTLEKIQKLDLHAVVMDHAGYFNSSAGLNDVGTKTKVYQDAKKIAENKKNPVLVVVVNHIHTEGEAKIAKGEQDTKMRAHGTSEAEKSADIEIALYMTKEDKRDGLINAKVNKSRSEENRGDRAYKLVANLGVCDYVSLGETKGKYQGIA